MTRVEALRTLVLSLDDEGKSTSEIADVVGIPESRVERILDASDPKHDDWEPAPTIEPLERNVQKPPKPAPRKPTKPRVQRTPSKPPTPSSEIRCGTVPGFYRHRRRKETPCDPCRAAYLEDDRIKRPRKRPPIECGTYRGYKKHRREGETPCRPCYDAYNESCRKWKEAQRNGQPPRVGRPRQPINHGTPAGYRAHRRHGEKPCDECRIGYNLDRLDRERRKRNDVA